LLWEVVERFREGGGTVVLTTHYMDEAAVLCDDIAVMDHGKIIARGSPRSLIDSLGEVQFVEFELADAPAEFNTKQLSMIDGVQQVDEQRGRIRMTIPRELAALTGVLHALSAAHVSPRGLTTHQATLDDVFLSLTGKGLSDD